MRELVERAANDAEGESRWLAPHARTALYRAADPKTRTESLASVVSVLLAGLLVPAVLLSLVLGPLSGAGITEDGTPVAFTGAQTALNFLALGGVALVYLLWRDDRSLVGVRRPTRRDLAVTVVGFVGFVAVMFALEFLVRWLGFEFAENTAIEAGQEHPEVFLLFIPLQFLFVAPAEELLFRGVVQGLLRRAYGIVPGVLAAGFAFSLFHVPALVATTGLGPTLAVIFVTGSLLGALYEYSGTLLVPIVVHALWNALVFALQYAQATGGL
jgi:membrane protease YdiL (CAAX protease family)